MFGYASDETPELMPMPITLAHRLARRLAEVRRSGLGRLPASGRQARSACATATTVPVGIERVLVSTQHAEEASNDQIREECGGT